MVVSLPTVFGTTVSSYELQKQGTLAFNLITALKQPQDLKHQLNGPRFHGYDQTGTLFGLAGYYRTIPVWNNDNPYQYAGFQANAGFAYNLNGSLANPYQFQSSSNFPQYSENKYSFPYPTNSNTPQNIYAGTQGVGAVFTNSISVDMLSKGSYSFNQYKISTPNLIFADTNFVFSAQQFSQQAQINVGCSHPAATGLLQTAMSPGFMLETPNGLEYLCRFSGTTNPPSLPEDNSFIPCLYNGQFVSYHFTNLLIDYFASGSSFDNNNPGSSYALPHYYTFPDGSARTVSSTKPITTSGTTSDTFLAKVDAGNGNYIRGLYSANQYTAGSFWYKGNVWRGTDGYNVGGDIVYTLSLDDPTDNGLFQSSTEFTKPAIQQIPGGGFLIMDATAYPGVLFLIMRDLKNYYRLNVDIPQGGLQSTYDSETVSIDASGFINVLQYEISSFGFQEMLYSGPGKPTIYLPGANVLSPVSGWSTICRNDDACSEPWEG